MNKFRITVFQNRKKPVGRVREFTWEELVEKLSDPVITDDTMEEYAAMTNEERTNIKDVGGYVGGECRGGRRSQATVMNRCLLTIDADDATPNAVEDFMSGNLAVFLCHTTHSSTVESPRLRWVFPLSRPVTGDEYRILVRIVKEWVGAETIDETTDQPERLMFWPSIGLDTQWDVWTGGTTIVDVDSLLEDSDIPESPASVTEKAPADDDFVVSEGQRNKTLFGFAAVLRSRGLNREDILAMLSVYNENHCNPPMPDSELETITRSVCGRYAPGDHVMPTLRDAYDDFSDLESDSVEKKERKNSSSIAYESVGSLFKRDPRLPDPIVENFLYPGLTFLVASPKYGKSWMCLDLGRAVASGEDFMGLHTNKTGVLYLAFEEADYILKSRLKRIEGAEKSTENFFILRKKVDSEGVENLYTDDAEDFPHIGEKKQFVLALHDTIRDIEQKYGTKIGLVIFDVFGYIRGDRKGNESVYQYDHRESSFLHKVARFEGVSILAVHHSRKADDKDDEMNNVSGSQGLAAGSDQMIVLTREKRSDAETFMHIDGRFFPSRTDVIQRDTVTNHWVVIGDRGETLEEKAKREFYTDPLAKTIIDKVKEAEDITGLSSSCWRVSSGSLPTEVKRYLGGEMISPDSVGKRLAALRPKLEYYEQITYDRYNTKGERGYRFFRMHDGAT